MRIVLQKNKQRELIELAKKENTWKALANHIEFNEGYLRNELRKEHRYLCEEVYNKLCKVADVNFSI